MQYLCVPAFGRAGLREPHIPHALLPILVEITKKAAFCTPIDPDIVTSTLQINAYRSKDEIAILQTQLLRDTMRHVITNSPYYKRTLARLSNVLDDFPMSALSELPFTTKDDLQGNESNFVSVPDQQIVEYVTTSGTLGAPVTFMLTENDLNRLAHNEYLSLTCAGGQAQDIYQIMVTLDKRFMAGMAYYLGARKMGAAVVRTGVESLAFQIDTINRIRPTILIAVPSFILKLIQYSEKKRDRPETVLGQKDSLYR